MLYFGDYSPSSLAPFPKKEVNKESLGNYFYLTVVLKKKVNIFLFFL